MDLSGKVALVTGAGSGIGFAIAERFAAAGAAVAINYYGYEDEAKALAGRLERAIAIKADVSLRADVEAMVAEVERELGGLDVLVNNAGIEHSTPFLEITDQDWSRQVGVDLWGAFLCAQVGARAMVRRGGGSIVNISSIHEDFTFPGYTVYCASKGALRMVMRNAALELAQHQIRVNNVAPGAIATPINKGTLEDPAKLAKLRGIIPLGRLGEPGDVAEVALFLASDAGRYVTGATYYVDGGMTRHAEAL